MSLVRFFELFEEKSCTLVKRLIFFGQGGAGAGGGGLHKDMNCAFPLKLI